MGCPAHTDPFLAMRSAAEHIAAGLVAEVELEWWADPGQREGMEHRMTITMRSDPTAAPSRSAERSAASHRILRDIEDAVPDDPSGLEEDEHDR